MILQVENLSKTYDGKCILKNVTFHIEAQDKLAVTGINGSGKTTLLRLITGEEPADTGSVSVSRDVRIGYLPQNPEISSERTVYEEVMQVKEGLNSIEQELRSLEEKMRIHADNSFALNDVYARYNRLSEEFESGGGYAVRSNVTGILKGLGFPEEEFTKKVSLLSGGQKTRLLLGKLLLESPDILILDEPTNHLDISSVTWLESYLRNLRNTVILVSHDRYFLDHIVGKVLDIDNACARLYTGSYTAFSEKKAQLRKEQMKAWLNNQAAIRHQQEVIEKLRSFNREKSIKRAESRQKMLDKMERVDKPFDTDDAMRLHFSPFRPSGSDVLYAEGLSKAYDGRQLFRQVMLDIKRGEKVAVIGPNGTGKTTLLKIINTEAVAEGIAFQEGSLVTERCAYPDSGEISFGTRVEVAYYDQEHQVLEASNTVFEEISDAYPSMSNTAIRNLLASFLFTGDDVFKLVRELSGGEKGRLSLAKLMLSRANFLLLDEPTNHLDITSKEILEEAVRNYEGTVLCVSHDRYFINRTATRILELDGESFVNYIGNYDYYLAKKADPDFDPSRSVSGTAEIRKTPAKNEVHKIREYIREEADRKALSFEEQKERRARRQRIAAALKKNEETIRDAENEQFEINELMTHPEIAVNSAKLNELNSRLGEISALLEQQYAEWEELSLKLEEIDNE